MMTKVPLKSSIYISFCDKKKEELQLVIEYLENRMTGNDFVRRMNQFVKMGERTGRFRNSILPMTRSKGLEVARAASIEGLKQAPVARVLPAPDETITSITRDYHLGLSEENGPKKRIRQNRS